MMKLAIIVSTVLQACTAAPATPAAASTATSNAVSKSDADALFNLLTSNNHVVSNLREGLEYAMPHNVAVCAGSFATKERSPEILTGAQPESCVSCFADGSPYCYAQYSEDSMFAKQMQESVDRLDATLTSLQAIHFLRHGDALMFDIDNTLAYTGTNDTDLVGAAPPITSAVSFFKKWCKGWGPPTGGNEQLECYPITARYCSAAKAQATLKWLQFTFPEATHDHILTHTYVSGSLGCSCCTDGNIAYKDILRQALIKDQAVPVKRWVASIGDQYTDSVGLHSGLKIKLPNVWFDSSIVANHGSLGSRPTTTEVTTIRDGASWQLTGFEPAQWADKCETASHAPIDPSPQSCIEPLTMARALQHASLSHCLAEGAARAPDQSKGCGYDISTDKITCVGNSSSNEMCA